MVSREGWVEEKAEEEKRKKEERKVGVKGRFDLLEGEERMEHDNETEKEERTPGKRYVGVKEQRRSRYREGETEKRTG